MDDLLPNLLTILSDSLFVQWVRELFSPDGGQPINVVFMYLNVGIFLVALGYGLFNAALIPFAMLKTKNQSANKGSVWGFSRMALVLLLLLPSERTGLNNMQKGTIIVAAAGNNLAQLVWNEIRISLFSNNNPVHTNIITGHEEHLLRIFELQACMMYSYIDRGRTNINDGSTVENYNRRAPVNATGHTFFRTVHYNSPGTAWNGYTPQVGRCGAFNMPDVTSLGDESTEVQAAVRRYQEGVYLALYNFSLGLSTPAYQFAAANHPRLANATSSNETFDYDILQEETVDALTEYIEDRNALFEQLQTAVNAARRSEYSQTQGTTVHEWLQAGGYWQRIAKMASLQHNVVTNAEPIFVSPQWDRVWPNPPHHVLAMRNQLSAIIAAENRDLTQNFTGQQFGVDFGPTESGFIEEKLIRKLRSALNDWNQPSLQEFSDPMSSLTSKGYGYLGMYGAIIGVVAAIAALAPPVAMILWNMTGWLRAFLMFAGILLAIVLPLIPYVLFMFGVVSWLLPIIFYFFIGSLWLIPNMKGDGNVALVGSGWTALIEIFLRPVLLIGGLAISYAFFTSLAVLIDSTLGPATLFSYDSIEGLLVFGFLKAIYALIMGLVGIGSFMLIVILPNQITQYLPQEGSISA